jgi:carbonic anhydrase
MSTLDALREQNRAWRNRVQSETPQLFETLAQGQSPDVLWIGCADSRVPPEQIVDAAPGDLFVHRNVANVIDADDPNGLSVVQYAVDALEVDHIVICGHYGCGGVQAALTGDTTGPLHEWLTPVRTLVSERQEDLAGLSEEEQWNRCCEYNVEAQVRRLAQTSIVQNAWERGQSLALHGWIYQLGTGAIHDLEVSVRADAASQ